MLKILNKLNKSKKFAYLVFDAFIINILTAITVFFFWAIIDSVDLFNPLDEFIDNFDFTDLYFTEFQPDQPTDTNIYIVNIGNLNRKEIADLIMTLQKFEPAIIGIDAVFAERRGIEDILLKQALNYKSNIVLGAFGKYDKDIATDLIKTDSFFGNIPAGHLEIIADPKTVREFEKFIRINDTMIVNSFAMEIASKYDYDKFLKFAKRKTKTELVNYRGGEIPFITFDYEEITDTNKNLEIIKNKIVLLGYVRMFESAPLDTLDAFYTPMKNSKYGYPDAKGIEIHAHILSMILSGNYINKVPVWLNYLIAFLILQLFLMWLVYYYIHGAKLFDILSKPIQFFLIILILWATFIIFSKFLIKFDMLPSVLALILCIDILYLYEEALELFKLNSYLTQNFDFTKDERNQVFRNIYSFSFIKSLFKRSRK